MISFTQGDVIELELTCADQDLTGAVITTIFKGKSGKDYIVPADQHTVDADQTLNIGDFIVSLTADDTNAIASGEGLDMIAKIVQSGSTIHFHGDNVLTVKKSTLRAGG